MSNRVPFQGFVGSAFKASSERFDIQDLWNWYVERAESPSAKSGQALLPCPGFEVFSTLPKSPVRGLFSQNDRTFAVAGDTLYELTREGKYLERLTTRLDKPTTPTITNSKLADPLKPALAPVVTHGGTIGSTTYGYKVTATNQYGETEASPEGTSPFGNASINATNWNIVSWTAVPDCTGYKLYRTTGGGAPPKLIAVLKSTTLVYNDIGTTGTSMAPPTTNTTGEPAGKTTYGYMVTATIGLAETDASDQGTTVTGPNPLTSTSYNTITWKKVDNARGYRVYRTIGGVSPPRLIAEVSGIDTLTINDTGAQGDSVSPPTGNTTGTAVIQNDAMPVNFSSSGDAGHQLFFVSGGFGYCYDLETDVLAPVLDGATFGGFIDSYFVALDAGTSVMKVSESFNGFLWDSTQVYQRQRAGDKWLAMAVTSNEIWLIGSQTGEVWQGTGQDETRFVPYTPVFIEAGIIAASTLTRVADTLMWVAQNKDGAGVIVRTNGYHPDKVSTLAVDHSIQDLQTIADGWAFSYQMDGHTYYVVTFPTDQVTWVYDLATNDWHRRGYWDVNMMRYMAYRPECHTFAFGGLGFGKNLAGDRASGRVCRMHDSFGRDMDGSVIRRLRQGPHIADRDQEMTFDRLQMDMDIGMGLPTGLGKDPTMMLSYSNDGGLSWGKELWRSAGKQGEHRIQVAWSRLGTAKNRVFRLVVSDPVPWRIVGAWLEVEGS